jgi:hypothetical protein
MPRFEDLQTVAVHTFYFGHYNNNKKKDWASPLEKASEKADFIKNNIKKFPNNFF